VSRRALLRSARRASQLSRAEWRVVAEAWWELLRADVTVSVRPYRQWRDQLGAGRSSRSTTAPDLRFVRLCGAAARMHVRPMTCLRRALALRVMFERRGHCVDLRFGVRRVEGRLDAHAWLVVDGVEVDTGHGIRNDYLPMHSAMAGTGA